MVLVVKCAERHHVERGLEAFPDEPIVPVEQVVEEGVHHPPHPVGTEFVDQIQSDLCADGGLGPVLRTHPTSCKVRDKAGRGLALDHLEQVADGKPKATIRAAARVHGFACARRTVCSQQSSEQVVPICGEMASARMHFINHSPSQVQQC